MGSDVAEATATGLPLGDGEVAIGFAPAATLPCLDPGEAFLFCDILPVGDEAGEDVLVKVEFSSPDKEEEWRCLGTESGSFSVAASLSGTMPVGFDVWRCEPSRRVGSSG